MKMNKENMYYVLCTHTYYPYPRPSYTLDDIISDDNMRTLMPYDDASNLIDDRMSQSYTCKHNEHYRPSYTIRAYDSYYNDIMYN